MKDLRLILVRTQEGAKAMTSTEYRQWLIEEISKLSKNFTREMLKNKHIKTLERIYDNI